MFYCFQSIEHLLLNNVHYLIYIIIMYHNVLFQQWNVLSVLWHTYYNMHSRKVSIKNEQKYIFHSLLTLMCLDIC